mmetsp:Transcript_2125/g.5434  ORF Transcript_2125/g.5434 Transcript_2125/m.5434 type:complete len:359 (-) Transcript_2125:1249-2325(-)
MALRGSRWLGQQLLSGCARAVPKCAVETLELREPEVWQRLVQTSIDAYSAALLSGAAQNECRAYCRRHVIAGDHIEGMSMPRLVRRGASELVGDTQSVVVHVLGHNVEGLLASIRWHDVLQPPTRVGEPLLELQEVGAEFAACGVVRDVLTSRSAASRHEPEQLRLDGGPLLADVRTASELLRDIATEERKVGAVLLPRVDGGGIGRLAELDAHLGALVHALLLDLPFAELVIDESHRLSISLIHQVHDEALGVRQLGEARVARGEQVVEHVPQVLQHIQSTGDALEPFHEGRVPRPLELRWPVVEENGERHSHRLGELLEEVLKLVQAGSGACPGAEQAAVRIHRRQDHGGAHLGGE